MLTVEPAHKSYNILSKQDRETIMNLSWIALKPYQQIYTTLYAPSLWSQCWVKSILVFFFFLFCWRISCEREDWYCLPHPVKSDVTDAKWCITELCITLRTIRRRNSCVATWIWWKCCLVAKSCSTLYDFMDCSTPGFPVLHYLLEITQIHVHWVGDAIQPSHPLLSPSPFAFNLSQHQTLFQWVGSLH